MGSIVANRYFNDPSIGQAFGNLAGIFAPPSGADLAGYADASATKQKAARLAELFSYAKDPTYNRDMADRLGIMSGLFQPNQSFYSVDQGNLTTQRGQDVTARTSLMNNAATNARALQQTQMTNDKDVTTTLLAPVGQDQTRFVPPALAERYNVPAQEIGILAAKPGETLTLPDNRVINGQDVPLTEEQMKAKILQGLPASEQRVAAIGNTPVETVIDPVTKQPTLQWRANSVGQTAYEKGAEPTELSKLMSEREALPPNDPRRTAYDARIAALNRGQQQAKYDQVNDEQLAKLNNEIPARAGQSFADKNMLTTLQTAINDPTVDQGSLGQASLTLRKYLTAFGVEAGNTSPAEMVNALGNVLALRLRDPSNGAGMPGALSDSDRQFLQSMTVALGNSPAANQKIVSYYLQLQQKNIDLEAAREQYIGQHGRLDDGWYPVQIAIQQKYGLPDGAAPPADQAQQPANATQTGQQPGGVEVWDFVNGKLQRVK